MATRIRQVLESFNKHHSQYIAPAEEKQPLESPQEDIERHGNGTRIHYGTCPLSTSSDTVIYSQEDDQAVSLPAKLHQYGRTALGLFKKGATDLAIQTQGSQQGYGEEASGAKERQPLYSSPSSGPQ